MQGTGRSAREPRILGVPVTVDASWILVGLLVGAAFTVAGLGAGEGALSSVAVAVGGAALLAVGVLAHELSHAVVAPSRGIPVVRVTLFAFGGYSQLEHEPQRPSDELIVAAAGPFASLVVAVVLLGLRGLVPEGWSGAFAVLTMLVLVNVAVAAFNLLPGLPLDGGRVLRAVLRRRRSADAATVLAARSGRALGGLLFAGGLGAAAAGWPVALWNLPVGVFLYRVAAETEREAAPAPAAGELMEPVGMPVAPEDVVVADRYLPVVAGGAVVGLVPPGRAPLRAAEAMVPLRRGDLVDHDQPFRSRMGRRRRPAVVVTRRRLIGVIPPKRSRRRPDEAGGIA
jgi:Zn-dependent protease